MNPELRPVAIVLLAAIVYAAFRMQIRLLRRDSEHHFPPRRMYVPLVVGAVFIVGYFGYAVLSLADPRKEPFDLGDAFAIVLKAVVLAVALNVKTLLGPLFVGYSIGGTVYCWFEYGEWVFWPLLDSFYDWVFGANPAYLKYVALGLTFVYTVATSFGDVADV